MKRLLLPLLLVLAVAGAAPPAADPAWRAAAPGYAWSFPRDLFAHPAYKTEWWYITGHLDPADGGEPLGYQLTFFRVGVQPARPDSTGSAWRTDDLILAHAAVSDPRTGHRFSEVLRRPTPFLGGFGAPGDSVLAWCRAPAGTDARWQLSWRDGAFGLQVRDDRAGCIYTIAVGVLGALLGGWLMQANGRKGVNDFDIRSVLVAALGAVLLLLVLQAVSGRFGTGGGKRRR